MNFGLLFHKGYLAHFSSERDEIWQCYGSGQSTLSARGPVIPFGVTHQSFTGTLATWFFDNWPIFADILLFFLFTALPED